jgi:hypothetical protein
MPETNSAPEMKNFFFGFPGHKKTGIGKSLKEEFTRHDNLSAVKWEEEHRSGGKSSIFMKFPNIRNKTGAFSEIIFLLTQDPIFDLSAIHHVRFQIATQKNHEMIIIQQLKYFLRVLNQILRPSFSANFLITTSNHL